MCASARVHVQPIARARRRREERSGRRATEAYVETTVVGCIACRRVSWPVTGDSYAVDITIMECVRLSLCLSLYTAESRARARICAFIHTGFL